VVLGPAHLQAGLRRALAAVGAVALCGAALLVGVAGGAGAASVTAPAAVGSTATSFAGSSTFTLRTPERAEAGGVLLAAVTIRAIGRAPSSGRPGGCRCAATRASHASGPR
jgi:hypothetical protein